MTVLQRIAKNTLLLAISQVVVYILTFFYTIYIARYLGTEGFGILSFALAFSGIFSILADLGLNTLIVRELSKDQSLETTYFGNIMSIKIILSVVTLIASVIILNLMGYSQYIINVVVIILAAFILNGISGVFNSIFQAREKIVFQSIGQILGAILLFLGVFLGIYYQFEILGFAFLFLFSNAAVLIYNFIISWRFFLPKLKFNWNFLRSSISVALPFGITGILGMLYTNIDSVMLSFLQGNDVVGLYNAAYRLILVLLFIPGIINITIFPYMSRFHISSKDSLKLINQTYFKIMTVIGIPMGCAVTILADKIIVLIFGVGYLGSVIALQILIWTIVFTFSGATFIRLFEATNRQLTVAKISLICVIVNILLNIALIPKFSYIGASISTVITEIILVGFIIGISYKIGYGIPLIILKKDLLKIIFASIIMSIFLLYFENLNLFILIMLSTILYLLILYGLKCINNEDITLFKKIINR